MNPLLVGEIVKNVDVADVAKTGIKYQSRIYMFIGCILLLTILFFYVRKKKDELREAKQRREYEKSIQDVIETSSLSYNEADYKIMADQIYTYLIEAGLMNGGFMGVNQKGIYAIMERMKTEGDIYKLSQAFGRRELRAPYKLFGKKLHTLETAFSEILFKNERKKIAEILAERGLEFPFIN